MERDIQMKYRLSDKISYRIYGEFTVLIDHVSGRVMRMNRNAGLLITRLDKDDGYFAPQEIEFMERLAELGLAEAEEQDRNSVGQVDLQRNAGREGNSVLEQLKEYAKDDLIPLICEMELTYACGQRCRHCYLRSETPEAKAELSLGEIKIFLDMLAEMGGLQLVFTGGDPLFRPDFMQIFEHARARRFAVQVQTSGTDVEPGQLERMAALGLDTVMVPLYGPSSDFHDLFVRRSGAFKAAWSTLTILKKLGVSAKAAIGVMPDNMLLIDDMVDMLKENGLGWEFNYIMLPERGQRKPDRTMQLDNERLEAFLRRYPPEEHPRMAGLESRDPLCEAGRAELAIDPYGNVYPCLMWREKAGNLHDLPLPDIWESSPVFEKARKLKLHLLEDCPNCNLKENCNRCGGLAWAEGLDITQHSELDCRIAALLCKSGICRN